jgi:hypothetical protein
MATRTRRRRPSRRRASIDERLSTVSQAPGEIVRREFEVVQDVAEPPPRPSGGVASGRGNGDRVSPVLLVSQLDRPVAYYRDQLGFRYDIFGDPPDFATDERDEATILLALSEEPGRIAPSLGRPDVRRSA